MQRTAPDIRKIVGTIHSIAAVIPFLFTVCLLLLFLAESVRLGNFPDTLKTEAGQGLLRSVSIFMMMAGYVAIALAIGLSFFRYLLWKNNWPTAKFNILMLLSIGSFLGMVYLNIFHLFTWMMG